MAEDEISRRAYEEGRVAQRIEMRLSDHDSQFTAMRASIAAFNEQLKVVQTSQESTNEKIDDLSTGEKVRQQTNEGIRKALQDANDKQISTRTFMLGVAGIILTIIGLVVSQAHIFGTGKGVIIDPFTSWHFAATWWATR